MDLHLIKNKKGYILYKEKIKGAAYLYVNGEDYMKTQPKFALPATLYVR